MKRTLVLVVKPRPDITKCSYDVNGDLRATETWFVKNMVGFGQEVPSVPYKAVYTLAPKTGKLLCRIPFMKLPDKESFTVVYNCFFTRGLEWYTLQ